MSSDFTTISLFLLPYDNISDATELCKSQEPLHLGISTVSGSVLPSWERETVVVSPEFRKAVESVVHCGLAYTIIFIGLISNALCLVVYFKQGLRDRVNVLLFAIAVADFLNLLSVCLVRIKCFMNEIDGENWTQIRFAHLSYVNRYLAGITKLLVLLMTVDRFLAVTLPLKAASLLTFRRMLCAIAFIYAFIFALECPMMVAYAIKWRYSPAYKRDMAYAVIGEHFRIDAKLQADIAVVLNNLIQYFSTIAVLVLSVISVVVLNKASRRRGAMIMAVKAAGDAKNSTSSQSGQQGTSHLRITKMLLFLSFLYVLCAVPDIAGSVTGYFLPDFYPYRKYHNLLLVYYGFVILVECFYSSVNFFAFAAMSKTFRKTLRSLCPRLDRVLPP